MAQSLANDKRLVVKARHGKPTMQHLCNPMDDDSSSCCERTGSSRATPATATARSLSGDERLVPMDFSSTHESRPNNLDYGSTRGNATLDAGRTARHNKMLNEERERREKNVGNPGGRGQLSVGQTSGTVEIVGSNSRHRPVPSMAGAATTSVRQKLRNSPANSRPQLTYSDLDDASSDSHRNNLPRSLSNNYTDPVAGGLYTRHFVNDGTSVDDDESTAYSMAMDDQPDQNHLVSRILEIKDSMHQALSMLNTVRNSQDQSSIDMASRLEELLMQLQSEEEKYLLLLRNMLAYQNAREHGTGGRPPRMQYESADDQRRRESETDANTDQDESFSLTDAVAQGARSKPNNHADSVTEQRVLMDKIMQQREKMKLLLTQQEHLNKLQQETERRLIEDQRANYQQTIQRNINGRTVSLTPVASGYASSVSQKSGVEDDDECSTVAESTASVRGQHHLENRLRDLRDKKRSIDELLSDLMSLNASQQLLNNGVSSQHLNDSMRATSVLASSAEQTAHEAERVLQVMETEHKLKKLREMQEKLNQLRQLSESYPPGNDDTIVGESRDSLRPGTQHFRAVQDDRSSVSAAAEVDEPEQVRGRPSAPLLPMLGGQSDLLSGDLEDEDLWKDNADVLEKVRQLKAAKERLHKLQTIVNQVNSIPGLIASLPDDVTAELNRQVSTDIYPTASASSGLKNSHDVSGEDEQLYENKMRQQREELAQLTAERQKLLLMQEQLCQLQETLVQTSQEVVSSPGSIQGSAIRQARDGSVFSAMDGSSGGAITVAASQKLPISEPPAPRSSPADLITTHAALVHTSSVAPAVAKAPQKQGPSVSGRRVVEPVVSTHRLAAPNSSSNTGTSLETRRLLLNTARENVESASKRTADALTQVKTLSASGLSSSSVPTQVTFQDPIETVMTNEELYDRMRQQRMLREELREKKKELEDMMRKEHQVKQNTRNQDTQSDVISFSNKSDQFGASASEDFTMATWGGSTAGNMESIEENDYRYSDDEEDEINNEEDIEDDDDDDNRDDAGLARAYIRHRPVEAEDEEMASGNDGGDASGSFEDEHLIEAARRRRVVSSNASSLADAYNRDETLQKVESDRRTKFSYNDWSGSGSRVVNDVHGCTSRPNTRSEPSRESRSSRQEAMGSLREDMKWLRKHVSMLARTIKHSSFHQEEEPLSSQQQLQQNQLMLSLNQSYFQLVTNQTALVERFNHLEQVVMGKSGATDTPSNNTWLSAQQCQPSHLHERTPFSYQERATVEGNSVLSNSNLHVGGSQIERSGSVAGAESGDVVIQTIHAQDAKIQDRSPWPSSIQRVNNAAYQPIGGAGADDRASMSSSVQDSSRAHNGSSFAATQNVSSRGDDIDTQSVTSGEMTAFDTLRETIYAEVATLISQNENSPHFLIELFRQLQLLSTDFLRQRALYAIQDIVARYFAKGDDIRWQTKVVNGKSLLSTNESLLNSEERSNVSLGDLRSGAAALPEAGGNGRFDFIENAESTGSRSQSTISDVACWDTPFAHDSLGDTVIHFDRALSKMREHSMKTNSASSADGRRDRVNSGGQRDMTDTEPGQLDDQGAVGGQPDRGSDGSMSDVAVSAPHIDTRQLDHEIKEIMVQIIPVVKQQMNGICSQQVLHYIQQLTLSLTRLQQLHQQPQSMFAASSHTNEFARFFYRQLDTILRDSLAKFEGRKMSECGEDLLVDLSEILFNELAFFRLMQDLDESKAKVRAKLKSFEKTPRTGTVDHTGVTDGGKKKSPRHSHERDLLSTPSPDTSSSEDTEADNSTTNVRNGGRDLSADLDSNVTEPVEDDFEEKDIDEKSLKQLSEMSDASTAADLDDDEDDDDDDDDDEDDEEDGAAACNNKDNRLTASSSCRLNNANVNDRNSIQREVAGGECDSDSLANMEIQLAPSETKPFTRIGSDEDDDDGNDDEEASADDPSETAVSRDAAKDLSTSSDAEDSDFKTTAHDQNGSSQDHNGVVSSSSPQTVDVSSLEQIATMNNPHESPPESDTNCVVATNQGSNSTDSEAV